MESNWDQFAKTLEEKVEARIAPLELQLNAQEELIQRLSGILQGMIDHFSPKPHNKLDLTKVSPAGSKPNSVKKPAKSQASDHDEEKSTEAGNS